MAVPTITDVSPATGPASGGNIVIVTGTNFRVPTIAYTIPMEDLIPTVSITVGGQAPEDFDVFSATSMAIRIPRYDADPRVYPYPAVDLVISNIDDSGVVIPGETVTEVDAYTYDRWVLGAPRKDPPMLTVMRELLRRMYLEITKYSSPTTHVDFGEDSSATIIAPASLPSVSFTVSMPRDIEWAQWDNGPEEVELNDGTIDQYEGMRTYMLVCDITAAGEGDREAHFIVQALQEFVIENPLMSIPADTDLYTDETNEYAIEISRDPVQSKTVSQSSIVAFSMQIRVRGIAVFPDNPIENVKKIVEFIYADMHMDGTTPDEWTW